MPSANRPYKHCHSTGFWHQHLHLHVLLCRSIMRPLLSSIWAVSDGERMHCGPEPMLSGVPTAGMGHNYAVSCCRRGAPSLTAAARPLPSRAKMTGQGKACLSPKRKRLSENSLSPPTCGLPAPLSRSQLRTVLLSLSATQSSPPAGNRLRPDGCTQQKPQENQGVLYCAACRASSTFTLLLVTTPERPTSMAFACKRALQILCR